MSAPSSSRESLSERLAHGQHSWSGTVEHFIDLAELLARCHEQGQAVPLLEPTRVLLEDGVPAVLVGLQPRALPQTTKEVPLKEATLEDSSVRSDPLLGAVNLSELDPQQRAYIAPERLVGLPNSELAEQFSFCAMLYEALYDAPPVDYSMRTSNDLPVLAPASFPTRMDVPRALVPVLRRGLAIQPSERWPDMRTLLEQLRAAAQTSRHQRTRLVLAASALGLVVLLSALALALT